MKNILLPVVLSISICSYSQRVAINTDGSAPNTSAILDVKSTNKGFLPPRIALTGSTDVTTIASPATGLLIYNTATAGSDPNTVSPGYYFYTGSFWKTLGQGPTAWFVAGNDALPGDYIGTNNLENFVVKVNGVSSGLIDQFASNTFWGYRTGINNTGSLNTGIGANALQNNTTGSSNTAIGVNSLNSNSIGENNNANGNGALFSNIDGNNNSAFGVSSLFSNTSGNNNSAFGINTLSSNTTGGNNTATGLSTLGSNTIGISNTANGANALGSNTSGQYNTAIGDHALFSNIDGEGNTASGISALAFNTTGDFNAANGSFALISNTFGSYNTAGGDQALRSNTSGGNNTAIGASSLYANTIGNRNIALGVNAGNSLTTGDDNIDIGNSGVAAESATIRIGTNGTHAKTFIAGINGATSASGIAVFVNASGQLGTLTSSARFKENIEDMSNISTDLLKLRPVTFVYKDEAADGDKTLQYGLIAEEVAKINPALVMFDKEGKPYTVRYQMLTPMLVNELQKEHKANKEQNEKIQSLQKQIDELKLLIGKSK